jgi:hypothetical protein
MVKEYLDSGIGNGYITRRNPPALAGKNIKSI